MAHLEVELTKKESLNRFYDVVATQLADLNGQLLHLDGLSLPRTEKVAGIQHCQAGINRIADSVRNSRSQLPPHDQRAYAEVLKHLNKRLDDIREEAAPRSKFSFRKDSRNASVSINDAAQLASQAQKQQHILQKEFLPSNSFPASSSVSSAAITPAESRTPAEPADVDDEDEEDVQATPTAATFGHRVPDISDGPPPRSERRDGIRKMSFSNAQSINLSHHKNTHIILPSTAAHATHQGTLAQLTNSVIDLSIPTAHAQPFASLRVQDVQRCLLVCGKVQGAAHLTSIRDSVVVVRCRQFRMHKSHGVDVYLHCGSRPIIEDCTDIRFTTLPSKYAEEMDNQADNKYDQIDDFNHPGDDPSPNWSLMKPESRATDDVWTTVVPGLRGKGHEYILKAAGVPERA